MATNYFEFGPHRFCNCHGGYTETIIQDMESNLDSLKEELENAEEYLQDCDFLSDEHISALKKDINDLEELIGNKECKLFDAIHELNGSRTELEQMEGGFFCPSCGAVYETEHLDSDEFGSFVLESELPYFSEFDYDDSVKSCDSFSLVVSDRSQKLDTVNRLIKICHNDIDLVARLEKFIVTEEELDGFKDPIGNSFFSYEEDINDESEDSEDSNLGSNIIDLAKAGDSVLPWVGQTVSIMGMLDSLNTNSGRMSIGAFKRYYKINHTRLKEYIVDAAVNARKGIAAITNEFPEIYNGFQRDYLDNLVDEYYYWLGFCEEEEFNGYIKHQYFRSIAIDHVNAGGQLKYYLHNGKLAYHVDSFVKDVQYVSGDISVLEEISAQYIRDEVIDYLRNTKTWWSGYRTAKGVPMINAFIFTDTDTPVAVFAAVANKEIFDFFKAINTKFYTQNTYKQVMECYNSGINKHSSVDYLLMDVAKRIGVKPTRAKFISSNKWIACYQADK